MLNYGCSRILVDQAHNERSRPQRKLMLRTISIGDELVLEKISKTIRSVRDFPLLLELCRLRNVRLISIEDKIDTAGKLFGDTSEANILKVISQLPIEVHRMRRSLSLPHRLRRKQLRTTKAMERLQREAKIINMYLSGFTIDAIMEHNKVALTTLFRILRNNNIPRNRKIPRKLNA